MKLNSIDKIYNNLCVDIMENGVDKSDRTGTGTISVFGRQFEYDMCEGFPLLSSKKLYWKGIATELLWFLSGDTNIQSLVKQGNNIWVGDALKKYNNHESDELDKFMLENPGTLVKFAYTSKDEFIELIKTNDEFAVEWGELGPIYGSQWRNWGGIGTNIDQIKNLIRGLKSNPDSRRLMVNAWNVAEIENMTLPPCHYGFQVYTRKLTVEERNHWYDDKFRPIDPFYWTHAELDNYNVPSREISLMWNQRSVDTFLGLPFNIASYGLLLTMIAKEVNMIPGKLKASLGDCHIYKNHIDYITQLVWRKPIESKPIVELNDVNDIFSYEYKDIKLKNYNAHSNWKNVPLSN